MSTNDVPGADPRNSDELATGCWAEHEDGSLIFVESTEVNRVIYSVFDMSRTPPLEYRDAMPEVSFKKTFSWSPDGAKGVEKWTWHDKTPFPWEKIIESFSDGPRSAAADHIMNAAERVRSDREKHRSNAARRVAERLELNGRELDRDNLNHKLDRVLDRMDSMWGRIATALGKLPGSAKKSGSKSAW